MEFDGIGAGQIFTLLFVSVALGMDAFSLGIALGGRLQGKKQLLLISLLVGLFHLIMPLIGMVCGNLVQHAVGSLALVVSAVVLLALGVHMILQTMREEPISQQTTEPMTVLSMVMFSLTVSVDSMSVGVSMGIVDVNPILALLMFACSALLLSMFGLWVGQKMNHAVGRYGEWAGGSILLALGVKFLYTSWF